MNKPRCKSCNAEIIWTVTEKGRRMPVDAEQKLGGNIVLRPREYLPPVAFYVKANEHVLAHVSHFVTCPQAAQHRKTS
jgi:hypothetical protein